MQKMHFFANRKVATLHCRLYVYHSPEPRKDWSIISRTRALIVFLIGLTLLTQPQSYAQAQPQGRSPVTKFGEPNCGEWINERGNVNGAWLVGYLSGVNEAFHYHNKQSVNVLRSLHSADQAFLWMDKWCRDNPLDKVSLGAMILFGELAERGTR